MPLGEVDDSGLDGIAVAPCDPQGDDTAERQVIICRSGYKNQAMHLQVLDLPSPAEVARALAEEEARHRRASAHEAASPAPPVARAAAPSAAAAAAATAVVASAETEEAAHGKALLTPREVANVYTTSPIQQIACFGDLLVVTNGRSVNFYSLGNKA